MFVLDVRLAALECLVDFVRADGKWSDLEQLITMVETDPDPRVRHLLLRMLIERPPFKRAQRHRLDIPDLVDRLWDNMKYVLNSKLPETI